MTPKPEVKKVPAGDDPKKVPVAQADSDAPEKAHEVDQVLDVGQAATRDMGADIAGKVCSPETKVCTTAAERKAFIEKNIKNLPKIAEALGGIDQLDLAKLSVDALIKLEDQFPGILLYAFTDIVDQAEKVDFAKWEFYKKPVAGQKLKVDFRGNEDANMEIGAADLMPPAVRCITVESEGVTRTSERRIGLKGRNKDGNGFFDKNGYMAVFTGDTIIVGGVTEPAQQINLDYEKPFLTKKEDGTEVLDEASFKKYEESEEGKRDKEFLDKMAKENPNAGRGKQMSEQELADLEARNTSSGLSGNIVKFAIAVARDPYNLGLRGASCCWDWASKVYEMAGAKKGFRTVFSYYGKYQGKVCGETHATEEQYQMLKPGDWIFYNNRNTADTYGCHSAIFIEWIDKDKKLARLASGSHGKPWKVHSYATDLSTDPPYPEGKGMPLILIGKPQQADRTAALPDVDQVKQRFYASREGGSTTA